MARVALENTKPSKEELAEARAVLKAARFGYLYGRYVNPGELQTLGLARDLVKSVQRLGNFENIETAIAARILGIETEQA